MKSNEMTVQEASLCRAIGTLLHAKIILKIQLIENKEVILFVQLNW